MQKFIIAFYVFVIEKNEIWPMSEIRTHAVPEHICKFEVMCILKKILEYIRERKECSELNLNYCCSEYLFKKKVGSLKHRVRNIITFFRFVNKSIK